VGWTIRCAAEELERQHGVFLDEIEIQENIEATLARKRERAVGASWDLWPPRRHAVG
jgi:hypothetical protein